MSRELQNLSRSLTYSKNKYIISKGKFIAKGRNSTIFSGTLNGEKIALKRVSCDKFLSDCDEEEEIHKGLDHKNVIKLLYSEKTSEFR